MKQWTIAKRIIIGGATLLALLLAVAAIGIISLRGIERLTINRLRDDAIPGIVNMADVTANVLRGEIQALKAGNATDAGERDKHIKQIDALVAENLKSLDAYGKAITSDEDAGNFARLKQLRMNYVNDRAHYLDLIKAGKSEEADKFSATTQNASFSAFRDQLLMMLRWNEATAQNATEELIRSTKRAVLEASAVAIPSIVIAVFLGWVIIRSVNRALKVITTTISDSANQVASAAGQVSANSQSLAEGASEQAASLEETSSSLEELSSMTKRNADSAISAKTLSGETRHAAEAGNSDMGQMRHAMDAIKASSSDIAKIIKSIDEIAFQTNILALNAAVEAARAGEAGAGFAVVAEEVRALAQRSANSAKETAAKIEVAIRNGNQGMEISEKVAQSLSVIVDKARKVDELVAEIATASQEQNQGIGQINTAVGQMDKVTQSNAGNAEETAAAAEELNAQSASLKEAIGDLQKLVGSQNSDRNKPAAPKPATAAKEKRYLNSPKPPAPSATPGTLRQKEAQSAAALDNFFEDA